MRRRAAFRWRGCGAAASRRQVGKQRQQGEFQRDVGTSESPPRTPRSNHPGSSGARRPCPRFGTLEDRQSRIGVSLAGPSYAVIHQRIYSRRASRIGYRRSYRAPLEREPAVSAAQLHEQHTEPLDGSTGRVRHEQVRPWPHPPAGDLHRIPIADLGCPLAPFAAFDGIAHVEVGLRPVVLGIVSVAELAIVGRPPPPIDLGQRCDSEARPFGRF